MYNAGKFFNLTIKSLGQPDMNLSITITAPTLLQLVHCLSLHMPVNTFLSDCACSRHLIRHVHFPHVNPRLTVQ